jgi:hypothetical protein
MRPRATAIAILAAAIGLLATPAGASAKPGFDVQERSLRLALAIKGSNGFRGLITTKGHKQVTLTLFKADRSMELRTSGRVSRRGISANFGDLGEVAVRFQDKSESAGRKPHRRQGNGRSARKCSGRGPTLETGVFHGTIRFRGENDFTEVNARRAGGRVERRFRRVCKRPPEGSFSDVLDELLGSLWLTLLEARARVDGANVTFEATSFDLSSLLGPGFPTSYGFSARIVERGDGMRVVRTAQAEGEEGDGTLRASKPGSAPRTVTVAPPAPFLESGKYLKERGVPASWTGALAARLPGAGLVPLTGPGFKSAICGISVGELLDGDRCLRRRAEPESSPLAALARDAIQGSGSQSQAFWDARLSWSR